MGNGSSSQNCSNSPGYSKVVVSANLADEILDEIYGKIENPKYENAVFSEKGAIEAPLQGRNSEQSPQASKSLADEILDELYGPKTTTTSALETENSYEEIGKSRNLESCSRKKRVCCM